MEEETRDDQEYLHWCRLSHLMLSTDLGKRWLDGLRRHLEYDSQCFRALGDSPMDAFAAATRDGARGAIVEIETAKEIGARTKPKGI